MISLALACNALFTSIEFALIFLPSVLTSATPPSITIVSAFTSALFLVTKLKFTVPLSSAVLVIVLLFSLKFKFKVPSFVIPSVTVNVLEFTFKVLFSSILTAF